MNDSWILGHSAPATVLGDFAVHGGVGTSDTPYMKIASDHKEPRGRPP
jgi:hypothetical protein